MPLSTDRLVVGVTGHRSFTTEERVYADVDVTLTVVEECFDRKPLTVLSPLAPGADTLVVARALQRPAAELIAILPLPLFDYRRDFASPAAQATLEKWLAQAKEIVQLPPVTTRVAAYAATGLFVVQQCDVLIAIWDGRPPRGPGGTGTVVAAARRLRRPLAWIRAERRSLHVDDPGDGPSPGARIVYEHWPCPPPPTTPANRSAADG